MLPYRTQFLKVKKRLTGKPQKEPTSHILRAEAIHNEIEDIVQHVPGHARLRRGSLAVTTFQTALMGYA